MRNVLVIGGSGFVGRRLLETVPDGLVVVSTGASKKTGAPGVREEILDVTDSGTAARLVSETDPDTVLFLAKSPDFNADPGPFLRAFESLLSLLAERRTRLIFLSTDSVFDGERGGYREDDVPVPANDYGRWKRRAEELVSLMLPTAVVVRTGPVYGENGAGPDRRTKELLAAVAAKETVRRSDRAFRSFVSVDDLAGSLWRIAGSDVVGIRHIVAPKESYLAQARRIVRAYGYDESLVEGQSGELPEGFGRDTSLESLYDSAR